jgi:hypothetical protein
MRRLALLCTALTALATPAKADYFVWQDAKSGVSLSYPDTWRMISNQKPDDVVTLIGPSSTDRPICRLREREDARYTVYPVWYSAAVQHVAYDETFWEDYTAEYNDVQVHQYKDDAALGRAFASMALASYHLPAPADAKDIRTSIMWGGVYYNTAYVLDCASTHASFNNWEPDFASIAKSVDTRKVIHELAIGNYTRNFINDGNVTFPVMNDGDKMGQAFP